MSAPHVAGLAALVQSSCALESNPQAVVDRITAGADQIPGTGTDWQFGRVNAVKSVCFPAPRNLRFGTVTASSIQLVWDDKTPGEASFEIESRRDGGEWQSTSVPTNTVTWTHGTPPLVVAGALLSTSALPDVPPGPGAGLSAGRYDYRVRGCDSVGCSDWSNQVTGYIGWPKLTVSAPDGRVTSTPAGINCGATALHCAQNYAPGTVVRLQSHPFVELHTGTRFLFDHWAGDCTGSSPECAVTMSNTRFVSAVYRSVEQPGPDVP